MSSCTHSDAIECAEQHWTWIVRRSQCEKELSAMVSFPGTFWRSPADWAHGTLHTRPAIIVRLRQKRISRMSSACVRCAEQSVLSDKRSKKKLLNSLELTLRHWNDQPEPKFALQWTTTTTTTKHAQMWAAKCALAWFLPRYVQTTTEFPTGKRRGKRSDDVGWTWGMNAWAEEGSGFFFSFLFWQFALFRLMWSCSCTRVLVSSRLACSLGTQSGERASTDSGFPLTGRKCWLGFVVRYSWVMMVGWGTFGTKDVRIPLLFVDVFMSSENWGNAETREADFPPRGRHAQSCPEDEVECMRGVETRGNGNERKLWLVG